MAMAAAAWAMVAAARQRRWWRWRVWWRWRCGGEDGGGGGGEAGDCGDGDGGGGGGGEGDGCGEGAPPLQLSATVSGGGGVLPLLSCCACCLCCCPYGCLASAAVPAVVPAAVLGVPPSLRFRLRLRQRQQTVVPLHLHGSAGFGTCRVTCIAARGAADQRGPQALPWIGDRAQSRAMRHQTYRWCV